MYGANGSQKSRMIAWSGGALEGIMNEMGFPIHSLFMEWIMLVVTIASYKYNIGGNQTKLLQAKRGLRQGDPMSPLLFVLVMEYLTRCMKRLERNPDFNCHLKCEKLNVINICFADDLMLFSRGDRKSIELMMHQFGRFSASTGLKANKQKCTMFFGGVDASLEKEIMEITRFGRGKLPVRYLVIPLDSKKLNITKCLPLIERITGKIKHWSVRYLSYADRLQLIQSVLFEVATYGMQALPIPNAVMAHMKAFVDRFSCQGKSL